MKPLTLSFQNIRSYTQFGPVSFDDRSLVGILGDTGAGKSTILEALCLALYGQSSWQGGTHEDLMADDAPHMSVDLTFAHDGHNWRVQRTYYSGTRPTMASLRNLDTGLAVDNVRAVNGAIVSLLRMDFDAFRSAVLLPQGQFQKLLHSSRAERTPLLKGIFGVDRVEQVAELARTRAEQLTALLNQAEVARAALPPDPADDAAAAEAAAQRYASLAADLDTHEAQVAGLVRTARGDRDELAHLRRAADGVNAAASELAAAGVADGIAAAAAAADDLAGQLEQCRTRTAAARDRARTAQAALEAAHDRGEGRSQVDAAITLLATTPRRAADLAHRAAEHGNEQRRIDNEVTRIAELRRNLAARLAAVAALRDAARVGDAAAEDAGRAVAAVRDACLDALTAAAGVRGAVGDGLAAQARVAEFDAAVKSRQAELDGARSTEATAEAHLSAVQRSAAGAVAAAGLHPGDDCPVCSRTLPTGWHPADPAADTMLRDAEDAAKTARAVRETAALKLEQVQTSRSAAETSRTEATAKEAACRKELAGQLSRLADAAAKLPVGIDKDALTAAASEAAEQAATTTASVQTARQVADELCEAAAAQVAELRRRAQQSQSDAATAQAQLESDAKATDEADDRLARESAALAAALERWHRDRTELDEQLANLPAPIRSALPTVKAGAMPGWLSEPASGPLAAAAETARNLSGHLAEQERTLADAREDLDDLSTVGEQLRARLDSEVAAPLRAACRTVERASVALADLAGVGVDVATPAVPSGEPDGPAMHAYLRAVEGALSDATTALKRRSTRAEKQAARSLAEALSSWRAALAAAADADDGTVSAPPDEKVLDADALTPVMVAARLARRRAEEAEQNAATARDSISRAAALDDAITAARARVSALSGLRTSLSRSRFPAHLVARRTQVLLGLASDLFGRLSGGEFGFSDDFQVVVRRSGSARDPKTLSGGETFLASLSLALSLVELYSRAGGRLGALFLDEGFGSLDLESLSAALDALAAETGGDKLVAVISHLHAVAEAVTDVLWVTKELGSSTASWLDPGQVEALVTADAQAGLLA